MKTKPKISSGSGFHHYIAIINSKKIKVFLVRVVQIFKIVSLRKTSPLFVGIAMQNKNSIKCLLLLLFLSVSLSGQNLVVTKKIKPAFQAYFGQPRMSIFLHTNKSAFIKGEHIWFKGYLYNRLKGVPQKEPVNLYVGIYDGNGHQLAKHLFLNKDGYAQGQIEIDSTFKPGHYYLKASTSWMRNFEEDDSFVQQFAILGDEISASKDFEHPKYDIQFLPEAGHWVNDVQGILGIKVLDEKGKSVAGLQGVIRNQKGEEITRFMTNRFGLSKVTLTPKYGELYWAFVNHENGGIKRILLPQADTTGLTLSTRNLNDGRVMILIGTNAETKEQLGKKPYTVLIHRDGLLKSLDVVFEKKDLYVSHILEKSEFHKGMNIITLVNHQGEPIAERLYFNSNGIKEMDFSISMEKAEKDSLLISISGFPKEQWSSLSVSVLPKETKAYNFNANIQSSFLLKPYVRGFIENSSYYFEDASETREADLDVLLLTQGWSKYSWNRIFKKPPEKKYDFRTGVDLFGTINSEIPKNADLLFFSGNTSEPAVIHLNEKAKNFKLNSHYFEKGEELKFTWLNKQGNLKRPNLFLRINTGETEDKVYELKPYNGSQELGYAHRIEENYLEDFVLPENTIKLDEVVVSEKVGGKRYTTPVIPERKLKTVTTKIEGNYPNLIDLIRSNGFNVWEMPNKGYDRIRITTKRPLTFSLIQPSPIFYIDDVQYADFNILLDFPTTRVEKYFIDRSGNGEAGGAGGVIRVYTRKEGDFGAAKSKKSKKDSKFFTHILKKGFTPKKKYYTPKYQSMMNDPFRHYGTIHWLPDLSIHEDGVGKFKIFDTGLKEIALFIEGMSENGDLYSEKKSIRVSVNQ